MEHSSESAPLKKPRRFRFSLGSMLLWAVVVSLLLSHLASGRRVLRLEQELKRYRPINADEVASQFQKTATQDHVAVVVDDVRYSNGKDAYRVEFTWTDLTTEESRQAKIHLVSDGFGAYCGQLVQGPFVNELGEQGAFPIKVQPPSPLGK